jgi:enoyl-CoA hydratase/carnithine racemase
VLEARAGFVLTLTLNRPAQKNAFNTVQWRELRDALRDAKADDGVRAVVITGAGGAFSAGQDLSEMSQAPSPGGAGASAGSHPFGEFLDELCAFDKPPIAAVNGVAVGSGSRCCLTATSRTSPRARACARRSSRSSRARAAASHLLPLLIGWRNSYELLYGDGWLSAARAVEIGLANRLCAPAELMSVAQTKAAELAALPPEALRHTKRLLLATREAEVDKARAREDDAFRVRVGSPENVEAVRAFFEKRPADFTKLAKTQRRPPTQRRSREPPISAEQHLPDPGEPSDRSPSRQWPPVETQALVTPTRQTAGGCRYAITRPNATQGVNPVLALCPRRRPRDGVAERAG